MMEEAEKTGEGKRKEEERRKRGSRGMQRKKRKPTPRKPEQMIMEAQGTAQFPVHALRCDFASISSFHSSIHSHQHPLPSSIPTPCHSVVSHMNVSSS